jgi:class 3 adenylate cyclase/tetratricopeptide (TPR) repeat protein
MRILRSCPIAGQNAESLADSDTGTGRRVVELPREGGDVGDRIGSSLLDPYVPRLVGEWLAEDPVRVHRRVSGTLAFVDISGFTTLTERLARKGRVGAEEMSDSLNATFGHLLSVADGYGADLVKWGGDAMLLMFSGAGHAQRGCAAAYGMRGRLRQVGRLNTTAGVINLRMSVGVHSGDFDYFLVGDPALHRELLVTGPAVSETARLEAIADAGQIVVGEETARLLGEGLLGERAGQRGRQLRRCPEVSGLTGVVAAPVPSPSEVDVGLTLPVAIREHLLAGPSSPEHRTIAVAFVQFSGTDELLERAGPEETAAALDDCIRNVTHAASAHGVTFFESDINVDGGKIMLTAGAPRTAGHDADRLLRTARRILDHAGRIPLRIGLNMGHVFSGDFGPDFRRTYSVKGDAINLAARVMGKAAPGELMATQSAYDHAETRFETTSVGPFTVKGKSQLVHAVSVGAITGDRERRVGRDNTLVGRDEEMAQLGAALRSVRAGRGGVVQLLGEPGIGKSRLMEELVLSAPDVAAHKIVCDEYQSATPYAAFRDLLRGLFGVTERTPDRTGIGVMTKRVEQVAPDLLRWLPLIGSVLDFAVPDTAETAELDDQFRKLRLELVVVDLLKVLLPQASLMTVDDAQHMDPASSDLLNKVIAETQRHPWLLVISRRDLVAGWIPEEDLESVEMRIRPLTAEDSIALALAASGTSSIPRPALAALAQKADGNPFFLESLVSQAGPAGQLDTLPESIEEVVAAQIDQLSPAQRIVLRHAAVLGSQFGTAELADLLPELPVSLQDQLNDGLSTFLVADDAGAELRFRHGLIREVAYQGMAYGARRRIHDQVGLAMERIHASTKQELLSFHFLHAGRYDKAWDYAKVAGEQAVRMYANTEATELLGRAVEASRRLPKGTVPAGEIARVLESLGDCWFTIGFTDAATDAYRQAHRQVRQDRLGAARMVVKQAMVEQRLRRFPQAMRRLRRELRALEALSGTEAHKVRSLLQMRYAISRISQGRVDEAIAWGTDAVDEAKRAADLEALAPAYATLHGIYLAAGRDTYRELGSLALQSYVELDDRSGQAQCTNNLAVEALENHRWIEAAELFGQAAGLYRRIGDTNNEGVAICNHAEVLVNQSRCAEALPLLEEALRTAYSVSDDELVALVVRQLGRAKQRSGDPLGGLEQLQEAKARFEEIDEPDEAFLTGLGIAEGLLLAGDTSAALAVLDTLSQDENAEDVADQLHALRGLALLRLGGRVQASSEFRRGLSAAGPTGHSFGFALNCLGLAAAGAADGSVQAERGKRALRDLGVVEVALLSLSVT